MTANYIEYVRGVGPFVTDLRAELKVRRFIPLPVREWMIPKSSGKLRRLGIPTVRDRVVQAALKLVLGTDLRGRLPAVFARLPASASGAGCPR
jgi:RNA-directed DNA polymerase